MKNSDILKNLANIYLIIDNQIILTWDLGLTSVEVTSWTFLNYNLIKIQIFYGRVYLLLIYSDFYVIVLELIVFIAFPFKKRSKN